MVDRLAALLEFLRLFFEALIAGVALLPTTPPVDSQKTVDAVEKEKSDFNKTGRPPKT